MENGGTIPDRPIQDCDRRSSAKSPLEPAALGAAHLGAACHSLRLETEGLSGKSRIRGSRDRCYFGNSQKNPQGEGAVVSDILMLIVSAVRFVPDQSRLRSDANMHCREIIAAPRLVVTAVTS